MFDNYFILCIKYSEWNSLIILSNGLNISTERCIPIWMPILNDQNTPAVITTVRLVRPSYAPMASCSVGLVHWSARNSLNSLIYPTDHQFKVLAHLMLLTLLIIMWIYVPSHFQITTMKSPTQNLTIMNCILHFRWNIPDQNVKLQQ